MIGVLRINSHNPKGDVKDFLESLKRAFKNLHDANDIEDPHTRKVAANCFNAQLSDIIHGDYTDDEQLTIGAPIPQEMVPRRIPHDDITVNKGNTAGQQRR